MIGVIVWSSAAKLKAVIWCEDQGALAYMQGTDSIVGDLGWPEAGDMVELETEVRNDLRHAFNVRIVTERKFTELPGILRDIGTEPAPVPARPALRVVASQDMPVKSVASDNRGLPTLFALSAGSKR